MSEEKQLRPWEAGFVAKESKVMSKKESGQLGGLAFAARKAAGLPDKPKRDKTTKQGRKTVNARTIEKAENSTEEKLTIKRKTFLDKFIYEYLHDFNASMAYIRAGGTPGSSTSGGPEALRTAYVQNQIRILTNQLEEEQIITRNEVLLGIKKEAHYHGEDGSSSARVRAWGMLAKIKGMDNPLPKEPEDTGPRGGVMEVPMAFTDVEWSEAAEKSQNTLKLDVRK